MFGKVAITALMVCLQADDIAAPEIHDADRTQFKKMTEQEKTSVWVVYCNAVPSLRARPTRRIQATAKAKDLRPGTVWLVIQEFKDKGGRQPAEDDEDDAVNPAAMGRNGVVRLGKRERVRFQNQLFTAKHFKRMVKALTQPADLPFVSDSTPIALAGRVGDKMDGGVLLNIVRNGNDWTNAVMLSFERSTATVNALQKGAFVRVFGWKELGPDNEDVIVAAVIEPIGSNTPGLIWKHRFEKKTVGYTQTISWYIIVDVANNGGQPLQNIQLEARLVVNAKMMPNRRTYDKTILYIERLEPGQKTTVQGTMINWSDAEFAPEAVIRLVNAEIDLD